MHTVHTVRSERWVSYTQTAPGSLRRLLKNRLLRPSCMHGSATSLVLSAVDVESSTSRHPRRQLLYLVSAENLQLEIQLISSQFTDVSETALVIFSLLTTSMVQVKLSVRCVCIIFRPHRMHGMQRCVTEVSRGLYVCMTSVAIGCISAIHAMLANNTNAYRLFGDMV